MHISNQLKEIQACIKLCEFVFGGGGGGWEKNIRWRNGNLEWCSLKQLLIKGFDQSVIC